MNYLKKVVFTTLMLCFWMYLGAQEEVAVREVIHDFARGIQTKDTGLLSKILSPNVQITSLIEENDGTSRVMVYSKNAFIDDFAKAAHLDVTERMQYIQVAIQGNFAVANTTYSFFVNGRMSHCGTDFFHLYKVDGQWEIIGITDTRQMDNCPTMAAEESVKELDRLVEKWHGAAATADEDTFFEMMDKDGIYIGTDATEYWKRDELRDYAQSAFERDVAWDFKKIDRHIYFSPDGNTAWWDERLNTWMGVCRGSGVLIRTTEGWKIKHYHLSVTLPNDKVKKFMKLVKKK